MTICQEGTQFPAHRMNTIKCFCVHTAQTPSTVIPCVHSMTLHISAQWSSLSVQLHPLYRTKSLLYLWSLDVVSISSAFLHSITIFFSFKLNLNNQSAIEKAEGLDTVASVHMKHQQPACFLLGNAWIRKNSE